MKLVMENKSGYIRSLSARSLAHPALASAAVEMSADPIENPLYLPNKEAAAKNPTQQRREEGGRIEHERRGWGILAFWLLDGENQAALKKKWERQRGGGGRERRVGG